MSYVCPCGACINGLKLQLVRAGEFGDPDLEESIHRSMDKRKSDPRYAKRPLDSWISGKLVLGPDPE